MITAPGGRGQSPESPARCCKYVGAACERGYSCATGVEPGAHIDAEHRCLADDGLGALGRARMPVKGGTSAGAVYARRMGSSGMKRKGRRHLPKVGSPANMDYELRERRKDALHPFSSDPDARRGPTSTVVAIGVFLIVVVAIIALIALTA